MNPAPINEACDLRAAALSLLCESDPQRKASLTRQYAALLATEGVTLDFQPEGIRRLAQIACEVNERTENIGARRLATVLERLLEEISFDAPQQAGQTQPIDAALVDARLAALAGDEDLSRYVL